MKKLSLIQRFSIISLIVTIIGALAFGNLVNHILEENMIENELYDIRNMVNQIVVKHFTVDELVNPKTGRDYDEFLVEMVHLFQHPNTHKIIIWNKEMTVVWSNDRKIVGQRITDNELLKRALTGEDVSVIYHDKNVINKYGYEINNILDLYIPIIFKQQKNIEIVFEVYEDVDTALMTVNRNKMTVWIWTVMGSIFTFIVFFGIVWNASRRLEQQKQEIILSQQDWENTFDSITDMITIQDSDCNILRANKAAKEILNIPDLEIHKGIKCFEYYHGTDEPLDGCLRTSCIETKKPTTLELFEKHLNRYLEFRTIPRRSNNQISGLIHIVRDITKRKDDEKIIETQLDQLNVLLSIDKAIIGSVDLRMTLDLFLDQVITKLKIDAASILLLNHKTNMLEYVISKGFRSKSLKNLRLRLGDNVVGSAVVERRTMVVSNLQEEEGRFNFSELLANEEFVTQIATPLITKGHVKGVLEIFQRKPLDTDSEWLEFLEAVADLGAIAIDNATMFDTIQRSNVDLSLAYESTIEGWSRAMDLRDKNTEGHSYRVMEMTVQMARKLEIKDEELVHIRRGALLHDMGKMGVPDSILLKSGPLTDEEWTIMRRHPENAWKMLSPIEHLRPAIDIPYFHHEKWDGTGYPKGLKGEEIPLAARIFAIVDVWDALTSNRPYRVAWPEERVLQHIRSLSGKHFDPRIVEIFEMMQDQFKNKFDPEGIRLSPAI